MATFREIVEQVKAVYRPHGEELVPKDVPEFLQRQLQAVDLVHYSHEYLRAAKILASNEEFPSLPQLQLTGQSTELALKACLAVAGEKFQRIHDLLILAETAQDRGFRIPSDRHVAYLVHLSHWYSKDLDTETRYKSRYPPPGFEGVGGSIPIPETSFETISSLCEQVRVRTPDFWPPDYTFLS